MAMDSFETVGLWVGINMLLMFVLKGAVGRTRMKTKVDFGAGKDGSMQRMMRVQGNAVEDVPVALIGLVALGLMTAPLPLLHGLGGTLFASRVLHAIGLGGQAGFSIGRMAGTIGSALVLLVTGCACVWYAFY